MSYLTLGELFDIDPSHRLVQEAPAHADAGLPYTNSYFREIDDDGKLVFRYRLWKAFEGHVYGAERLDPAGNVLERLVGTDRHPHHQGSQEVA